MDKLIAKKLKMTQVWRKDKVIPVTVIKLQNKKQVTVFKENDQVRVSGLSKGRGFQGVVKRHGFHGGPKSHGQKDRLRAPGSIGSTDPGRVIPGKKMAGRMGSDRITLKSVSVVEVNSEAGTLMIKGPLPGMSGSKIEIIKHKS